MPAKVSLFNMKAEPIFDFGTGPRNLAYFNPHGNNILMFQENLVHVYIHLCFI